MGQTRHKTESDVHAIASAFKRSLRAGLVLEGTRSVASGIGNFLSGLWNATRSVEPDAFAAVRDYEMPSMGLRQLTASQIIAAGVTNDMAQAKRLTQAMMDFSAGARPYGDHMNRIMLNMGQMTAAANVTDREIRDLAMGGLPIRSWRMPSA